MAALHITDIEAAINWWRERSPSPDGVTACAEVRALAEVYALMVVRHESECDEATHAAARATSAWLAWYASTPDAPCIAICSTSQGDDMCKGCGRTFDEVQHWPAMTPAEKRRTWRRITMEGTAWRFTRYAERALRGERRRSRALRRAPAAARAQRRAEARPCRRRCQLHRNPRMSFADDARRLAPLAWPVFVGQLAVLGFATIDTVLVARYSALDLAALAVGNAAYVSVFVGLMGVVLAVGPIAGKLFGGGRLAEAGQQYGQALWLALALSVLGCALLVFPQPFLAVARAEPDVADKVRAYLGALAFALPPALLFTAFRGFNTAVSRPKAVMVLQLGGLALKVPLSALLVYGLAWRTPLGELRVPSLGVAGCGVATAIVMWCQWLAARALLRRDAFYVPFGLQRPGSAPPQAAAQRALLRLGVPMGLSIALEVTGFTFMALFISRLGATPVAGHQIAVNLVSLMFMMPLSLGNAACTLVAQRLGASDLRDARRLSWHGLELGAGHRHADGCRRLPGCATSLLRAYTHDAVIIAAALPLLAWVMLFHIADAAQTLAAFTLRAYHLTVAPMLIYAASLWGVGLGGGFVLAFNVTGLTPPALHGAPGFWAACTTGITLAALALCGLLGWVLHTRRREERRERRSSPSPAAG